MIARLFSRPGYYELVGGPQVGKTTVACLLARRHESSIFITTHEEDSPTIYEATGVDWTIPIQTVADFFEIVRMAEPGVFIILDSLATLTPDHPASKQIAGSISRHIVVSPPCPVLILNQERYPISVGGVFWRANLRGRFRLVKHRQHPLLLSRLGPTALWLIWKQGERPELRLLLDEERKTWLPDVAYSAT